MCNDSWGRSSFARCLIEINLKVDIMDVVTIGIPLLTGDVNPPIVATSNVVTPIVEKTNDGFQTMGKRKKEGKSESTNGGQFGGPSVKQTIRYEPKATTSAPKKGVTKVGNSSKSSSMTKATITSTKKGNIATSNPYSALEDESDEDVKNIYDESANLVQSTKISESSSTFTAAAS
ncbi:hypothetical protein Tco_0016561 [Tanacetum coccineum]